MAVVAQSNKTVDLFKCDMQKYPEQTNKCISLGMFIHRCKQRTLE